MEDTEIPSQAVSGKDRIMLFPVPKSHIRIKYRSGHIENESSLPDIMKDPIKKLKKRFAGLHGCWVIVDFFLNPRPMIATMCIQYPNSAPQICFSIELDALCFSLGITRFTPKFEGRTKTPPPLGHILFHNGRLYKT